MDYDYEFEKLEADLDVLKNKLRDTKEKYKASREFTAQFLSACSRHKIKAVSIQKETKKIKESVGFPFGVAGEVFAEGKSGNWPAIWAVVQETGTGGGCGSTDRHQINYESSHKLIDGVYEFKNGKWKKTG